MKCQHKTEAGECQSHAMNNEVFCFLHNPKIPLEAKREAQAKGGRNNRAKQPKPLDKVKLDDSKDVVALVAEIINCVREGLMDVKVANCLGFLAGQLLKAVETATFENRMDEIEKKLEEQQQVAEQMKEAARHN